MGPACHICYEEYGSGESNLRPRMLPCGHTLCTGCLGKCKLLSIVRVLTCTQSVQLGLYTGRVLQFSAAPHQCPTCRRLLPAGNSDPESYPLNYALEDSLREDLQVAVTLLLLQLSAAVLCQRGPRQTVYRQMLFADRRIAVPAGSCANDM